MIIGKDNFNKNFTNNYNPAENLKKPIQNTTMNAMQNKNIMDKNDVREKAYAMLEDRYSKGLISIEEFSKKCKELNKR